MGAQFFGLTHKKSRSVKYDPEEAKARFVVNYVNYIRLFHDKTKVIELLQHISQSKYTKYHADLGQPVDGVGAQFFGLTHKKSISVKYVSEEARARFVVNYVNDIRLFCDKTKVIEILQHIS